MPKQQEVNKYYVIFGQYNSRHVFKLVTGMITLLVTYIPNLNWVLHFTEYINQSIFE